MLMAAAEEAGVYVAITREETAPKHVLALPDLGSPSGTPEQPYIKERPTNVRPRHR